MTASLLIPPVAKFWNNGVPLAAGKVYTYAAGTVSTNKASYTDFTGNTPNANPVILDSNGEAEIWLSGNYKINVTDKNGVQMPNYPVDNVSSLSTGTTFYTTTGSVNNYILTPSPAILAYANSSFFVVFNVTNTGPSTINISNLGSVNLVFPPAAVLVAGNILAGIVYEIIYDGTNFQVLNISSIPSIYTTTGLANTYILTPTSALNAYSAGIRYYILFNVVNTNASTINISGLGAKSLVNPLSAAVGANQLRTGIVYEIIYDGTNFQVLNIPLSLVLLSTATASTSAIIAFNNLNSTYWKYVVEFNNVVPDTNAVEFRLLVSTDNGVTYDTGSNYSYSITQNNAGTVSGIGGTAQGSVRIAGSGIGTTSMFAGNIEILNPSSTIYFKTIKGSVYYVGNSGANVDENDLGARYHSNTAINAIAFLFSSGNIATGTFKLYGEPA